MLVSVKDVIFVFLVVVVKWNVSVEERRLW